MSKRYSNFMITINSNIDYDKMTDEEKTKFKNIAKYVFSNNIQKYVQFSEDGKSIYSIEPTYRFEIAPTNNRLHLHGIIKITHNSKIKLDLNQLRKIINASFEQNVHLNVIAKGDETKMWEDYINKGKAVKVVNL